MQQNIQYTSRQKQIQNKRQIFTKIDAKGRCISKTRGRKSLKYPSNSIILANNIASMENISILDCFTRLWTNYLDLHLRFKLKSSAEQSEENDTTMCRVTWKKFTKYRSRAVPDLPFELRSVLVYHRSKFYISLKSFFFVCEWEHLWVEVSWRGAI